MAEVDFVPFAAASGANVETQAQYLADAARGTGVMTGLAKSALYNKSMRQATVMASVLAQTIAAVTGENVIDDGTTLTIIQNFLKLFAQTDYNVQAVGGGSWTCPNYCYAAEFTLTGGGGGGAGSQLPNFASGGGGGAGGTAIGIFAVTPGTAYSYTVGAGGSGGAPGGSAAGSGGATQITVGARVITAYGGQGAAWQNTNSSAGGGGGGTSGGITTLPGGIGSDGCNGNAYLFAGNGAPSFWGGQGRAGAAGGYAGTAAGAGGGGSYNGTGYGGGGAPGLLRIRTLGGLVPGG